MQSCAFSYGLEKPLNRLTDVPHNFWPRFLERTKQEWTWLHLAGPEFQVRCDRVVSWTKARHEPLIMLLYRIGCAQTGSQPSQVRRRWVPRGRGLMGYATKRILAPLAVLLDMPLGNTLNVQHTGHDFLFGECGAQVAQLGELLLKLLVSFQRHVRPDVLRHRLPSYLGTLFITLQFCPPIPFF